MKEASESLRFESLQRKVGPGISKMIFFEFVYIFVFEMFESSATIPRASEEERSEWERALARGGVCGGSGVRVR